MTRRIARIGPDETGGELDRLERDRWLRRAGTLAGREPGRRAGGDRGDHEHADQGPGVLPGVDDRADEGDDDDGDRATGDHLTDRAEPRPDRRHLGGIDARQGCRRRRGRAGRIRLGGPPPVLRRRRRDRSRRSSIGPSLRTWPLGAGAMRRPGAGHGTGADRRGEASARLAREARPVAGPSCIRCTSRRRPMAPNGRRIAIVARRKRHRPSADRPP